MNTYKTSELMTMANRLYRNPNPLSSVGMESYTNIKAELSKRGFNDTLYLCLGCDLTCGNFHNYLGSPVTSSGKAV